VASERGCVFIEISEHCKALIGGAHAVEKDGADDQAAEKDLLDTQQFSRCWGEADMGFTIRAELLFIVSRRVGGASG
jgi:hypothetical protein